MEILQAIERADALCPNHYSLEEKLCWCDEVTAELRRNIIKTYDVIEAEVNSFGELNLPFEVPFANVEAVFCGGNRLDKEDFRSFVSRPLPGEAGSALSKRLKVVYLVMPEKIRFPDIRGEFNTGDNTIEMDSTPFREGDRIEIVTLSSADAEPDWTRAVTACVMETQLERIILDRDAVPARTDAPLAIRRIIEDITAIEEAPYDGMYIEYLLAKMALYQHDYTGYNAHMTQYNSLYEAMRREYRSRGATTALSNLRNYSCY